MRIKRNNNHNQQDKISWFICINEDVGLIKPKQTDSPFVFIPFTKLVSELLES